MASNSVARFWSVLGVATFVWALPCLAQPTAETVLRQIDVDGPRVVLERYFNDWQSFERVCDMIETADPRWLEVARRLKPASDAALSLSLNYSVARAIPQAPERVLALIGQGFTVEDICTTPFIESEPGVAEEYQRRAIAALRELREPVATVCLAKNETSLVTGSH